MEITQQLQQILQDTFKLKNFRPGQLEAITLLLQTGRLLCIQPTGYGKSLLYQVPAVYLDGITLVISPLLALMRDQMMQLKNRFNIGAVSINTDQTQAENAQAFRDVQSRIAKILFIAPEQLDHPERFAFLLNLPISLLVVDEAHCISTWGHDFRPSYRQIIKLARALITQHPDIKLLGLTATANAITEVDIKKQLSVDQKIVNVHRESMDRPNIKLSVIRLSGVAAKLSILLTLLNQIQGSGLIYCATRESTELVAEFLNENEVCTAAYHAGMDALVKQQLQHDFLADKYKVIVATNALGMGIDKTNLRFIIHMDFPGSVTAYYQEVGRCGRDGLPAEGILLYDSADSKIQRHFIYSSEPTLDDFQQVTQVISTASSFPTLGTLRRLTGMHQTMLIVVLAELLEQGFIEKIMSNRSQVYKLTFKKGQPDLSRFIRQLEVRKSELAAMQKYGESEKNCLMRILRAALGDLHSQDCGQCSVCLKNDDHQHVSDKKISNKNDCHLLAITSWLDRRTVAISLKKLDNVATGMAVLNGKLRSSHFVKFMHERIGTNANPLGIPEELFELIKSCLLDISKHYKLGCIIPLPSRTWLKRDVVISCLSQFLKLPAYSQILQWQDLPKARQGELLNNDQRKYNVEKRLTLCDRLHLPPGAILLLDDYVGSGMTLTEAVRCLRENAEIRNEIVPFTIAAVQWRVGKAGMI